MIRSIQRSLVKKIITGYFVFVLLPTLLVGMMYLVTNRNRLIEEQQQALNRNLQQSCINGVKSMERIEGLNLYLQQNNNFLRFLDGDYPRPVDQLVQYVLEFQTIINYMHAMEDVQHVDIYVCNSAVLRFGQNIHHIDDIEGEFADIPAKGIWQYDVDKNIMIYRKAITDAALRRMLAVLEVNCSPKVFISSLDIFGADDQYQVQLHIDGQWYTIAGEELLPEDQMDPISTRVFVEALNAEVLVKAKWDQLFVGQDPKVWLYMLMMVLPLLAMTGVYFSMAYNISRRITAFKRHIMHGNVDSPMPNPTSVGDDIDELIKAYNEMLMKNDVLVGQVKIERLRQKEASFLALQAQMNPHFIYNSLEDIRMMAELRDDGPIADAIYALGRLIRYALTTKARFVTLKDELEYTTQYLQIEKMRLDERLNYDIFADPDAAAVGCPKFILQPLVENAIVHGLSKSPGGGKLVVRIDRYYDGASIEVSDDGVGLGDEKINLINRLLCQGRSLDDIAVGNGIGLGNVNTRMRQQYGDVFSLFLSKNPQGHGVITTMRWKGEVRSELTDRG